MSARLLLALALAAAACRPGPVPTPRNRCVPLGLWRLPQRYELGTVAMAGAIPVDVSGTTASLPDLERRARAVAACLGVMPDDGCPAVVIAPDAVPSCAGPWQLLPILAPDSGCEAKGQAPSSSCPCRWRAGVQPDGSVVVPPDMYNLGDPLTRIWGNVDDPWTSGPRFSTCALAGDGLAGAALGGARPAPGSASR